MHQMIAWIGEMSIGAPMKSTACFLARLELCPGVDPPWCLHLPIPGWSVPLPARWRQGSPLRFFAPQYLLLISALKRVNGVLMFWPAALDGRFLVFSSRFMERASRAAG